MVNTNYSVRTKLRTDKVGKDGTCPIVIQVILNSKVLKFTLRGESINPTKWDAHLGRAKGKGYKSLNILIDKKEQYLKDFLRLKISDNNGIDISEIRSYWNGEKNNDKNDFYSYFADFCRRKRELGDIRESTFRHYITLEKKLRLFRKEIAITEIDLIFMTEFYIFLEKSKSGRYNMIKFLKCVLRDAESMGLLKDSSWKTIKNPQSKPKIKFLLKSDLRAIKELNLSDKPILDEIRNMFLFSCYTGLRYSDVIRLKKSNLNKGAITFIQHKTSHPTVTPLTGAAFDLIKKQFLKINDNELIFTPYANTYANRKLKEIFEMVNLPQEFSYHISRHTFASTLMNNGIDSALVSKMMGHTKPLQTFNYMHSNVHLMKESISGVRFT